MILPTVRTGKQPVSCEGLNIIAMSLTVLYVLITGSTTILCPGCERRYCEYQGNQH